MHFQNRKKMSKESFDKYRQALERQLDQKSLSAFDRSGTASSAIVAFSLGLFINECAPKK